MGLDVADVQFVAEGLVITLRRSKTDQDGEGLIKGIAFGAAPMTCPVRALRAWLDISKIAEGSLFRSLTPQERVKPHRLRDYEVAKIVKASARQAGLDPRDFSGQSLRVGLATAAARAGVPERIIAEQTGHKEMNTLRRYIWRGELFRDRTPAKRADSDKSGALVNEGIRQPWQEGMRPLLFSCATRPGEISATRRRRDPLTSSSL